MYILMTIKKNLRVGFLGMEEEELPLHWADGMIGACPIFDTKEAAERFRGKRKAEIYEVAEVNEESTDDQH